jgi:hypothetical protein
LREELDYLKKRNAKASADIAEARDKGIDLKMPSMMQQKKHKECWR